MMNSGGKSKGDYEPIPDVENGPLAARTSGAPKWDLERVTSRAKETYVDLQLDDDQARLLGTLDEAMKHGKLDLNLGDTVSTMMTGVATEEWIPRVREFAVSLIQPTLTALATSCMAIYLQGQVRLQQAAARAQESTETVQESWSTTTSTTMDKLVMLFPYINATLIFAATVMPLQQRFMEKLVLPVFKVMNQAENLLQKTVRDLGPFVDKIIDGIQRDFHTVMKPIQPTLDQIENKAHLLEKVEKMDIPDPSDIDREIDEAQGIVNKHMDEAEQHLQYEDYVPDYLDSPRQFYRRIVVPVIVLAWILQILVALGNESWSKRRMYQRNFPINPFVSESHQRVLVLLATSSSFDMPLEERNDIRVLLPESATENANQSDDDVQQKENATFQPNDLQAYDIHQTIGDFKDNLTLQVENIVDNVQNKTQEYQNLVNESWNSFTHNMTDQIHAYDAELRAQYLPLVHDVIWSYAMAVLQMLCVYVITNKAVQAWVVRQGMKQIQAGAERTLTEYGVSDALDDVFTVRFSRIRAKILKLIRAYKRMEQLLQKLTNILPEETALQVQKTLADGKDAVQEALKGGNQLFGKFFKSW